MFYDFAENGDDEEKLMEKGDDPGLEQMGMKSKKISYEKWVFLLKKYETSFPLFSASLARPAGYPPWYPEYAHTCGIPCRTQFIKVGHTYICRSSGNVHVCPPEGCRSGVVRKDDKEKHCPITGNNSYAFHSNTYESTAGMKRKFKEDEDVDYEGMGTAQNDLEDMGVETATVVQCEEEEPIREEAAPTTRLSKEGQQSNAKDISMVQGKADSVVASVIPSTLLETIGLRWIVDEHVLYCVDDVNTCSVHPHVYRNMRACCH